MNRSDLRVFESRVMQVGVRAPQLVSIGLIAWASVASLLVLLDLPSAYRPLITLSFLIVAPGLALVRLLRLANRLMELTLALALSLAVVAIIATLVIYANAWSEETIFFVLAYITFIAALVDLIRSHNAMLNAPAPPFPIWELRVGLVLAFTVGTVLLLLFFNARAPRSSQPVVRVEHSHVRATPTEPNPFADSTPPSAEDLSELERMRRIIAIIVSGAEEPSTQSRFPNSFPLPVLDTPDPTNVATVTASRTLTPGVTGTPIVPVATADFAATSVPPFVAPPTGTDVPAGATSAPATNTPLPSTSPTNTPVVPTAMPPATSVPPSPEPPAATQPPPTSTPVPPTATPEPPTATPLPPSPTPEPPTATPPPPSSTPEPLTATPPPPTSTPEPPTSTPVLETETPPPPTETPEDDDDDDKKDKDKDKDKDKRENDD